MTVFGSKFLDGHIIVEINHFDYIVDTGSPVSFGRGGSIFINGQSFLLNHSAMNLTPDSISKLSGLRIDGVIGMDILSKFDIQFSLDEILFSNTAIHHSDLAIVLPVIDTAMIVPIISLTIAGEYRRLFFDTGAKLSYLSNDLLSGVPMGQRQDFHPSIGRYTTNVYMIDVGIQTNVESLTFGSLPPSLTILLEMGQAAGVVGTELLNKYTITLSNSTQTLVLEPNIEN